ncbi:hypothetical protein RRG08_052656 [Elysia crispata]|uniref:Uncharacterized protein n=1 Tax=Elysia crispata TaxID=231223 RepID=A0AAE0ZYC6_9GAST|nr:hypothetical protein RRG08_052656 [Elysia crispata]
MLSRYQLAVRSPRCPTGRLHCLETDALTVPAGSEIYKVSHWTPSLPGDRCSHGVPLDAFTAWGPMLSRYLLAVRSTRCPTGRLHCLGTDALTVPAGSEIYEVSHWTPSLPGDRCSHGTCWQ